MIKSPLWNPGKIGSHVIKNRTVRSATNEHMSETDGTLTPAWAEIQICLAEHEVGLVITGHFAVDRTQRSDEGQPYMDWDTNRAILKYAADGVHRYGAKLVAQLSHSGMKAAPEVNGCQPKGPSDFSEEELDLLVEKFRCAAAVCRECGLDGVQIHLAHGYLLSSFLNPRENLRTDFYGGSLQNRFRLAKRIIHTVRKECGADFMILVKINCDGTENLHELLQMCEDAGVDAAEISGLDFISRSGIKQPFYLSELSSARDGISIPLFLVGGIFSQEAAECVLSSGAEFVSFSRALICDPGFIEKLKLGLQKESVCFACNGCFRTYRSKATRCVQHSNVHPHYLHIYSDNV